MEDVMGIYAYINKSNSIGQINSKYVPMGIFAGKKFDGVITISPQTQAAQSEPLDFAFKSGDVVITSSLTNFSLDLTTALQIVYFHYEENIRVIAYLEDFDSFGKQEIALLESIPFMIKFRRNSFQAKKVARISGIKRAAKEGKYKGRQALTLDKFPNFRELYDSYMYREIGKSEFAEKLGVSRPTLDRLLEEFTKKKG